MQGMLIDMEEAWLQALAQVKVFLDGTAEVAFRYPRQSGVGLSSLCSNGLALATTAGRQRHVPRRYRAHDPAGAAIPQGRKAVEPAPRTPNHDFTRRFTATDVAVLAEMDVRSPSWDSMWITARSTSITKSPGCWKRCGPSSPHHAPDTPTIPLGSVQERRSRAQT